MTAAEGANCFEDPGMHAPSPAAYVLLPWAVSTPEKNKLHSRILMRWLPHGCDAVLSARQAEGAGRAPCEAHHHHRGEPECPGDGLVEAGDVLPAARNTGSAVLRLVSFWLDLPTKNPPMNRASHPVRGAKVNAHASDAFSLLSLPADVTARQQQTKHLSSSDDVFASAAHSFRNNVFPCFSPQALRADVRKQAIGTAGPTTTQTTQIPR